ncbi:hypothetical protein TVAG_308110 [Trichomonas vaginalis G3]|uniref:WD repeat protein n=1 Tax=Trichomonas vaginalis (strain ATCC PRA-98 / G3) TaxID=412133 RepID=A2EGL0_TRIV3|nr:WD repeat-containing protein 17 family [Trichomonas vaginalis G3]EAY08205.1 hypothetical protein TVAG_308110 [Trichomonas vaginalis G3]KAI5519753.1 WD repeat-containing protein 17 family [Trichomonas vaginalis G3]|eukprot:XP_001320428.1 hypothetical protein [Trichomonas vaginalis G3]
MEIKFYDSKVPVKSMVFSPLNEHIVLIITREMKWIILNVEEDSITKVSESLNKNVKCSAGYWFHDSPTTIITSDPEMPVLYMWSIASGEIFKTISLAGTKVSSLIGCDEKSIRIYYLNGSVSVYNFTSEVETTIISAGHTDSILSGKFMPHNGNILSTVSVDGRHCFWSIPTMKLNDTMVLKCDDFKRVYCVEYSPGGGYIVTGHDNGYISVYSTETRQLLIKEKLHNGTVLSVSWCKTEPNLIASISSDASCIIYDIEKRKIDTPIEAKQPLQRIQWSPFSTLFGIACKDGNLYIRFTGARYTVINIGKSPLRDIQWSLFDPKIIAAANEDGEIAICDVEMRTFKKFQAHKGHCYSLAWSPSLQDVLISAGRDGFIRIWNAKTMFQISNICAHISSVFCIVMHQDHPFLVATMSKNTTVGLWSIEDCFPELMKNVLSNSDKKLICQKISIKEGSENMEKLVHRVLKDGIKTTFNDKDIVHLNDISIIMKTKAENLLKNIPLDMKVLERAKNSKSKVISAAELYLKMGNHKKYCELMFVCGEFDKVLAAAPYVSYNFWKSLMESRAKIDEKNSFIYNIIAGEANSAIDDLANMKDFDGAFLVLSALQNKKIQKPESISVFKESVTEKIPFYSDYNDISQIFDGYEIITNKIKDYKKKGKIFFAAALYLAFGDYISACWLLSYSGESLWAVEIAKKFNYNEDGFWLFHCTRMISQGIIDEAFDLASLKVKKILMLMLKSEQLDQNFYAKHGLQNQEYYLLQAQHNKSDIKALLYIIGGRTEDGISMLTNKIQKILSEKIFDFVEFEKLIEILERVPTPTPLIIALSYYKAIYKALWLGFIVIIPGLIQCFLEEVNDSNLEFLKCRVEEVGRISSLCTRRVTSTNIRLRNIKQVHSKEPITFDGGRTVNAYSGGFPNIDAEMDLVSIFNTRPTESFFFLEDKTSFMLKTEALKWFSVTPFSPVRSHQRFYPF